MSANCKEKDFFQIYKHLQLFTIIVVSFLFSACANKGSNPINPMQRSDDYRFQPVNKKFYPINIINKIKQNHLQQKISYLLILVDESQAMNHIYQGMSRKHYLKNTLQNFQNSIPKQLQFKQSIHMFGQSNKQNIHTLTSLSNALLHSKTLLAQHKGNSAILILSDWNKINSPVRNTALDLFRNDPELCIHMVGIGNIHKNNKLKDFTYCGVTLSANRLQKAETMADFVEKVFYTDPADKDLDGIYDYLDKCPGTKRNTPINWLGCPRNSHRSNPRYQIPQSTYESRENIHEK